MVYVLISYKLKAFKEHTPCKARKILSALYLKETTNLGHYTQTQAHDSQD